MALTESVMSTGVLSIERRRCPHYLTITGTRITFGSNKNVTTEINRCVIV